MAFCTNCGAQMEGSFCSKCGAGAGAAAPAAVPAPKKRPVLTWVLVGCGGLVVLALIGAITFGLFVRSKVGDTKNPAVAAARMMAAMNPNVEVVGVDEGTGKVTFREKKTGRTVTLNFQDIQKGRIAFEGDHGEKVDIQVGQSSAENVPAWVPKFPGAQVVGNLSAQRNSESSGTLQLKCSGSLQQVADSFEQQLKTAGMKVDRQPMPSMVHLYGVDDATGRKVTVVVTSAAEGTSAQVAYTDKK